MSRTVTTTITCPKCDVGVVETEDYGDDGSPVLAATLAGALAGGAAGFLGCLATFIAIAQLLGHRGTP